MNTSAQRLLRKLNALKHQYGQEALHTSPAFDPELMYVECGRCGRPVIWEPGRTSAVLYMAEVDLDELDSRCLLVSDGCNRCTPGELYFDTRVMRLGDDYFFETHHRGQIKGRA